jgi:hypothetical protein
MNLRARKDQQHVSRPHVGVVEFEFHHGGYAVVLLDGFKGELFGVDDQGL